MKISNNFNFKFIRDAIESFLRPENPCEVLYVIPQGQDMADVLQTFPVLDKFKKKAFILMNISTQGLKVDKEFFKKNLMVVELTRNIFEHLYQKFQRDCESCDVECRKLSNFC